MEKNDIKLDIVNGTIEVMFEDGSIKKYTQENAEQYSQDTKRIDDLKIMNWPSDFPSKHDKPEDYEPTES